MERSDWVIVAIPSEDDPVWKVSSEKTPHMTLLYFGEQDSDELAVHIGDYLEHSADTMLYKFGMSVSKRGTLGDKDADVLFFDKGWSPKVLGDFRSALLKDSKIKIAYDSTEQYPEWTPHLTLGYPDTPAHEVDDDRRISWVNFDKVALWFGDSEGVEFDLRDSISDEIASWSENDPASGVLSHFGIKGMRWGVRRERNPVEVSTSVRPGQKVRAKGGENQLASEDAIRSARLGQIARKSSTDALSTKELQELVNRMNLERQYSQIVNPPKQKKKGSAISRSVNTINEGKQVVKLASDTYSNIQNVRNFMKSPLGDQLSSAIADGNFKSAGDLASSLFTKKK